MRNFISEDNIEQAILQKLEGEPFQYDETEHFAVFDRKLVWHGGMNLLGKQDEWDNLICTTDHKAAAELIEIAFLNVQRS